MKDDCLFCKIYQTKDRIIFENEFFYSQFDKFPVSPGHAEIIPKRHIVSLFDMNSEEWNCLFPALKETVSLIEATDFRKLYSEFIKNPISEKSVWFCQKMLEGENISKKPDGYNFGNNDGEVAGRTIHHLHIHIIPRYLGDVKDPRGGIRHIIPNMGNYC